MTAVYTVDEKDEVHKLDGLPKSSPGAPMPVVLSDEHRTYVAYMIHTEFQWDGETCQKGELFAIVQFLQCEALMFGPPSDEIFHSHPLESRGLEPYRNYQILHSSWIRALERMNSVHPLHRTKSFKELRHFVLSFHDSTFECVAKSVEFIETFEDSTQNVARRLGELMARQ
jgi:hypothetical protein